MGDHTECIDRQRTRGMVFFISFFAFPGQSVRSLLALHFCLLLAHAYYLRLSALFVLVVAPLFLPLPDSHYPSWGGATFSNHANSSVASAGPNDQVGVRCCSLALLGQSAGTFGPHLNAKCTRGDRKTTHPKPRSGGTRLASANFVPGWWPNTPEAER